MRKLLSSLVITFALAPVAASAGQATTFDEIAQHYEAIRQSLMKSTTDGVAEHARAIRDAAGTLEDDFSPSRAGISADGADTVRTLLPEVARTSGNLAEADGISNARSAFSELTKPLVRWQSQVTGPRPIVVYCPMEKKSWLQPDEQVGNPYAPSMPRCGEVVAR